MQIYIYIFGIYNNGAINQKRIQYYCKKTRYYRASKTSTEELINTFSRYDSRRKLKNNRRKLLGIGLKKIAKIQNISKNELNKAEKLKKNE